MLLNYKTKMLRAGLLVIIINTLLFSFILFASNYFSNGINTTLMKIFWLMDNNGNLLLMYLPFFLALYGLLLIYKEKNKIGIKIYSIGLLFLYVGFIYFICYIVFFIIFTYGTYLITGVMPH